MRKSIFRATLITSSMALLAMPGGFAAAWQAEEPPAAESRPAGEDAPGARDEELARARETLSDLLASEMINRIDFEAETYAQGMANIHATADRILEMTATEEGDIAELVHQISQVIEALNSHAPRGLVLTFGSDVKRLPVVTPAEARQLGELVGSTVSLIRNHFRGRIVSYHDAATKLFRSVVLDVGEGPFLEQYLDGIQRVADLPPERRARFFH